MPPNFQDDQTPDFRGSVPSHSNWQDDNVRRFNSKVLCKIKELCGNCRFVNDDYEEKLKVKYQEGIDQLRGQGLLKSARQLPALASPRQFGYRASAKLAVRRGEHGETKIGLFKPGTHRVVEIDNCPLHTTEIKNLIKGIRLELTDSQLDPYDEETGQGKLRYILLRSSHITGELSLTWVVAKDSRQELMRHTLSLRRAEFKVNCAFQNINDSRGNNILGARTQFLVGNASLREQACGFEVSVKPQSFFQTNPWMAELIYRRMQSIAGEGNGRAALDLYSGIGITSLALAEKGFRVTAIEENPSAIEDAEHNVRRHNQSATIQMLCQRVEDSLKSLSHETLPVSLVLVNPSRRGLDHEVRLWIKSWLEESKAATLIYLSCSMESMARDLSDICQGKPYLKQLEAFDMFPQTHNLEWLGILKS
jgi:23S rRNA (uracil1939-C5)-methyltransferase